MKEVKKLVLMPKAAWYITLALFLLLGLSLFLPREFPGCQHHRVVSARITVTKAILAELQKAVEAFQKDFGQFPPSRFTDEPYDMQEHGGAGLLAYYLMGPKASGWGGEDPQVLPFGGTSGIPVPTYARAGWQHLVLGDDMRPVGFTDAFQPPKKILYFRAEPGREPLFDVRDNPVDPTGKTGFASQEHFEMLAKRKGPDGKMDWVRKDFLLISAGPDRWFGHVIRQSDGTARPARPEEADAAKCDDVTNSE